LLFRGWGAERQEGGGLARAWTTRGPKMLRRQRPDEAPGGAEGTVTTKQQFCFVCCRKIYEKYITKIEANLSKSVAYKTLDIHVPLFNPLLHALFYCKASN